jgi:hypothetical protein
MSYDSAEVIALKVKRKQQQVELTIALNTRSTNYDDSKGIEIIVVFHSRGGGGGATYKGTPGLKK